MDRLADVFGTLLLFRTAHRLSTSLYACVYQKILAKQYQIRILCNAPYFIASQHSPHC